MANDRILLIGPTLLRTAVLGWLDDIDPTFAGGIHWGTVRAPRDLPLIQTFISDPGQVKRYIGMPTGWITAITLRAIAADAEQAQAVLLQAAAAIPPTASLTDTDYAPGWSIRFRPQRAIPGVPQQKSTSQGLRYRVTILPVISS